MSHRVYQQASFIGLMLSFLVVGCASGKGSSALLMVNSGGTAPAASQQPDVFEKDAKALIKLRGTYLCDQRVYPPHGRHISAWEWAFKLEPPALAAALVPVLKGAQRDGLIFRWMNSSGEVEAVVDVQSVTRKSTLNCGVPPAGTRSFLVVSRL